MVYNVVYPFGRDYASVTFMQCNLIFLTNVNIMQMYLSIHVFVYQVGGL